MATHTGTHLDAPCHFAQNSWCLDKIPLERLVDRPAIVLNVTQKCADNSDYLVTVDDLTRFEKQFGRLQDGSVLLIKTGWGLRWGNEAAYFGNGNKDETKLHFPGLDPSAAIWLVKNRKIYGIGIEGPSLDNGPSLNFKSHQIVNGANIYMIENVPYEVSRLPPLGAFVTILPLKITEASGTPIRMIATIDRSVLNAAVSFAPSSAAHGLLIGSIMFSFMSRFLTL